MSAPDRVRHLISKLRYMGRQYCNGQVMRGGPFSKHYLEEAADELEQAIRERDEARAELERERLRLAACGVAALGNTEQARAHRLSPENEYYSASYADVCAAVDREMALRAERDAALRAIEQASHGERCKEELFCDGVCDCWKSKSREVKP